MNPFLECHAFSAAGLHLAARLASALRHNPWLPPAGEPVGGLRIHAPERLAAIAGIGEAVKAFASLGESLAGCYAGARGHVFIGALGLAARALAPHLRHKSLDPPVIVLDAAGRFAISFISGHWGGANSLAAHVAALLGALPVISTASDRQGLSLDSLLRSLNLKILDWPLLAPIQGLILEGGLIDTQDPWGILPPRDFLRLVEGEARLLVDFRKTPPGLLRVAAPLVHIGMGFRAGLGFKDLADALLEAMDEMNLETKALAGIASVAEKADSPPFRELAAQFGAARGSWPAPALAAIPTPEPSPAAGARFGLPPFSVAEAAALLSASSANGPHRAGRVARAFLLRPKLRLRKSLTVAAAIAPRWS